MTMMMRRRTGVPSLSMVRLSNMALLLLVLFVCWSCLLCVSAQEEEEEPPTASPTTTFPPTVNCPMGCGPDSDLQEGYAATLEDLQCQMSQDFVPSSSATRLYRLCPNTMYMMTSASSGGIVPLYNNTFIQCGESGSSNNNCIIARGSNQFLLAEPLRVTLQGLTFQDNGNDSIDSTTSSAILASGAHVDFQDCHWRDLDPPMQSVIQLMDATASFQQCSFENITVTRALVSSLGGGGLLTFQEVQMNRITIFSDESAYFIQGNHIEMNYVEMYNIQLSSVNPIAVLIQASSQITLQNVILDGGIVSQGRLLEMVVNEEEDSSAVSSLDMQNVTFSNLQLDSFVSVTGLVVVDLQSVSLQHNTLESGGLIFATDEDVVLENVEFINNTYSGTLLSYQAAFPQTLSVTDSRWIDNSIISSDSFTSLVTLRGTASFETVEFRNNEAQLGIEAYAILQLQQIVYSENTAQWHLYARPGATINMDSAADGGGENVLQQNIATIGLLYLEQDATMNLIHTQVQQNIVQDFHLVSILEGSELVLSDSTVSENKVARALLFAFDASQATLNRVQFRENEVGMELWRAAQSTSLTALLVTAIENVANTTLVRIDQSSSISVSLTDFVSNRGEESLLMVDQASTAIYAGVNFLSNIGATEQVGMLQLSQTSSLTLSTIDVSRNTFDHVLLASGGSSVDVEDMTVTALEGISASWDTIVVTGNSVLDMTNVNLDSAGAHAVLVSQDESQIVWENVRIANGAEFGMLLGTATRSILSNICFIQSNADPLVWSSGAAMVNYANVSGTGSDCAIRIEDTENLDFDIQKGSPCGTEASCRCEEVDSETCTNTDMPQPGLNPTRAPLTRPPTVAPTSSSASTIGTLVSFLLLSAGLLAIASFV